MAEQDEYEAIPRRAYSGGGKDFAGKEGEERVRALVAEYEARLDEVAGSDHPCATRNQQSTNRSTGPGTVAVA